MNIFDKTKLANSILSESYDLSVISPIDEGTALQEVLGDIDKLLELNSLENREARCKYFKIPGTTVDSYKEGVFEFNSSCFFLAGIRHIGGDPNLPFVNITPNFKVEEDSLREVVEIVNKEFSVFSPRALVFWINPDDEKNFQNKGVEFSRRYMARRISELNFKENSSFQIDLRLMDDDSYFSWYEKEYKIFHQMNSTLENWVRASSKNDLEEYRAQNLLWAAYKNDKIVGLIGAESLPLLGLSGVCIGELLITNKNRGKGYAVPMQKLFLEKVHNSFSTVWGTIDAKNIPSTKTALHVGRKAMRTEVFISLI